MNHSEILTDIYNSRNSYSEEDLNEEVLTNIKLIGENCLRSKGVYTVITTLLVHKIIDPTQDIRLHQSGMDNGFSGRSIDNAYITPTLKCLNLPSMAESGWLTRSLEQPFPYDMNYKGKISGGLKAPFLEVIDYIQNFPDECTTLLAVLLKYVEKQSSLNKVAISKLSCSDTLTIDLLIAKLEQLFFKKYGTHGGAKLPVLAFYAIYKNLIPELKRFDGCELKQLGSLTASDRTSRTSGDIEIMKDGKIFESIELKLDKLVDIQIINVAKEKVLNYNPTRYYILSAIGIKESDYEYIRGVVDEVYNSHGCQIIVNGLLPTIKYYLRLIVSLEKFIDDLSCLISDDDELKPCHKQEWNTIIEQLNTK